MNYTYLHDGLEHWRQVSPDKIAIEMDETESLTYAALGDWSDGVAGRLIAAGVCPGDRVIVTGANAMAFVASAFGILKAGAIIVPLNDRFTGPELRYLIDFSGAAAIVADSGRQLLVESLGIAVPSISFAEIEDLRQAPCDEWRSIDAGSDPVAMIVFTSGSTGTPKGVMLSHSGQLGRFLEIMLFSPGLGPNTNAMMPMGIQAAPGTAWGFMFSSVIGGTFYFNSKYNAHKTLSTLVNKRIDFFNAVPLIYREVSKLPEFATADLSHLAFARCGGARLPTEVWNAWDARE